MGTDVFNHVADADSEVFFSLVSFVLKSWVNRPDTTETLKMEIICKE